MKNLFLSAATVALLLGGAEAKAAELPTYEVTSFPITPHQMSVLGAANVQERSPAPALMLRGMPASPHQVLVLTPRQVLVLTPRPKSSDETIAAKLTKPHFPQR